MTTETITKKITQKQFEQVVSFTDSEIITLELILEKYNFLESEIGYDPEMGKDVNTILQKIEVFK